MWLFVISVRLSSTFNTNSVLHQRETVPKNQSSMISVSDVCVVVRVLLPTFICIFTRKFHGKDNLFIQICVLCIWLDTDHGLEACTVG